MFKALIQLNSNPITDGELLRLVDVIHANLHDGSEAKDGALLLAKLVLRIHQEAKDVHAYLDMLQIIDDDIEKHGAAQAQSIEIMRAMLAASPLSAAPILPSEPK